jgi:hypothetical protein
LLLIAVICNLGYVQVCSEIKRDTPINVSQMDMN